jgi:copper homeostasis protein
MEVCVDSVQSALNAAEGGATRIELCANLMEGGTTPTTGMLKVIKSVVTVPVFVMVRPRGGDFLYDEHEFKVMKEDMKALEAAGADGIVFGILCKDGSVDQHRCQEVLGLTQLPVTFHRAFDMVNDPVQALEEIIGLGFKRVLTSGQETSAMDGAPLIAQLIEQAKRRITVVPAGGISARNLSRVLSATGAKEFHCSARRSIPSQMIHQKRDVYMGGVLRPPEFSTKTCDINICKELVAILDIA